jgi:hypothetical protein
LGRLKLLAERADASHRSEVGSKDTDVKKVVISAAIAVVLIAIIAAGGNRTKGAPAAAPAASKPSLVTTTSLAPRHRTSSGPARTVPPRRGTQGTSGIGHAGPKPRPASVAATGPHTTASLTTATSNAAQVAALRTVALQSCLELAAVNNARVVAANNTWYHKQLSYLTAHHLLSSGHYQALQIEQNQAQLEIQAQYAIDQSNCYLKDA